MKPSDIVAHLRARCPGFARNVAAGINWDDLQASSQLPARAAYVVPTDEKAGDPLYENVIVQELVEGVDIVVAFPQAKGDEGGYGVADEVSAVRKELCRALVGWTPPGNAGPLIYDGRRFVHTDRAKAVYAFSFSAVEMLGDAVLPSDPADAETWEALELLGLPELKGIDIRVDSIDPMVDRSLLPHGQTHGPDGRIEHQLKKDIPHD